MRYENSAAGRQLTLLVNGLEVPVDETERERFLDDIENAVQSVLTEHDLDVERLRAIGGHSYSAIEDRCPICADDLVLVEPTLDSCNGVHARASCECGWFGEAVYRLIDLHETTTGGDDQNAIDDCESVSALFEENSSVSLYDLDLRYYPY